MDPKERQELIRFLHSSRQDYLSCFDELPEDLPAVRPSPEAWSILDCAEHVALVESAFYEHLCWAPVTDEPVVNPQRERRIREQGPDRSRKIDAPGVVLPTGRFATLDAALEQFRSVRERTIQFVEAVEDLRSLAAKHVLFGPINGLELVLFICTHPLRHADQVRELRARAGALPRL